MVPFFNKIVNYVLLRKEKVFLTLILMLAVLLRIWNFNFDANTSKPLSYDFLAKIKEVENISDQGSFKPSNFRQPPFLIYTSALIYKGLKTFGVDNNEIFREAFILYMILFSVLTVLTLFFIGKNVFNEKVGLLAALIMTVVPVNVIGSRYFKEDMPLMFFLDLAFLFIVILLKTRKKYYYFLVATAIGLAISTKYAALIILPVFFLAHLFFIKANFSLKNFFNKEAIISFLIIIAVFLAVNPYTLISWNDFKNGFLYQVQYSQAGHHDETIILAKDYFFGFYLLYAIIPGVSLLVTLAFFGGAAMVIFRKKNMRAILILVFIILYYLVFEYSKAKPFPFFSRYLHPIFPLITLFAAYFLYKVHFLSKNNKILNLFSGIFIAIIILIPFVKSYLITKEIKNDTRFIATAWINQNFPVDSKIYLDDRYYSPRPREGKFDVKAIKPLTDFPFENYKKKKVDYVILNNFRMDRYWYSSETSEKALEGKKYYEKIMAQFELVKEFRPPYGFQTYGFHNPTIKIYKVH